MLKRDVLLAQTLASVCAEHFGFGLELETITFHRSNSLPMLLALPGKTVVKVVKIIAETRLTPRACSARGFYALFFLLQVCCYSEL
jgi:hypothetical protein